MDGVDLNAFAERMESESERACAVLGAALLDAKLGDLFRGKLRCFHDELLKNMGPLSTFSARIRLARALDWIDDRVRSDLDTIRSIRNDFAHNFDLNLSFSVQSVTDRCGNLNTSQAFIDGHEEAAVRLASNFSTEVIEAMQAVLKAPRWRFQLAIEFLSQHLDQIKGDTPPHNASGFFAEIRALGANSHISIAATGIVGPLPPNPPST